MTRSGGAGRVLMTALLAGAITACGLKGSLELPERSTNIVIRGPGEAPAAGTEEPTGGASPTPAPTPGTSDPAKKPAQPKDERLPPPQLPDGNPGSGRGG
jgi:predicted small lipoprotein YifL